MLLQRNLCIIKDCCRNNLISLNISKCLVVPYTKCRNALSHNYTIGAELITRQNKVKDLGVLFDAELSFSEHISAMCLLASRYLGFLVRSCRNFNNLHAIKSLYYCLVRSRLEYESLVRYPYYIYQNLAVEIIQKRFLKYLNFPYW